MRQFFKMLWDGYRDMAHDTTLGQFLFVHFAVLVVGSILLSALIAFFLFVPVAATLLSVFVGAIIFLHVKLNSA